MLDWKDAGVIGGEPKLCRPREAAMVSDVILKVSSDKPGSELLSMMCRKSRVGGGGGHGFSTER